MSRVPEPVPPTRPWRLAAMVALAVALVVGAVVTGHAVSTSKPVHHASAPTAAPPKSVATEASVCPGLSGVTTMADGMVMAAVPHRAPTAAERARARELVARVTTGTRRYATLTAARAAGYVPATNPDGYVVHYADWATVRAGDVLDPDHPSSLVYANTRTGPVLLGAMFMGPGPCRPGPAPGGPLTQWHAHDNLCLSAALQVTGSTDTRGNCATGHHNVSTYFMLHVWTTPSLAGSYQFETHLPRDPVAAIIRSGQG